MLFQLMFMRSVSALGLPQTVETVVMFTLVMECGAGRQLVGDTALWYSTGTRKKFRFLAAYLCRWRCNASAGRYWTAADDGLSG